MTNKPLTPTKRERSILALLAEGLRYKEIQARLDIAEGTLKNQIYKMYRKFGFTRGRYDAAAYYARLVAREMLEGDDDGNPVE